MAIFKKLRFFVKKPQYAKTYFMVKNGAEPKNRDVLSAIYEHKPIMLNSVKFYKEHVYAEARKTTVWFEGIVFGNLPCLVLYFSGKDLLPEKYFLAGLLGVIFGALIGLFRIDRQRAAANKFNQS